MEYRTTLLFNSILTEANLDELFLAQERIHHTQSDNVNKTVKYCVTLLVRGRMQ